MKLKKKKIVGKSMEVSGEKMRNCGLNLIPKALPFGFEINHQSRKSRKAFNAMKKPLQKLS